MVIRAKEKPGVAEIRSAWEGGIAILKRALRKSLSMIYEERLEKLWVQ